MSRWLRIAFWRAVRAVALETAAHYDRARLELLKSVQDAGLRPSMRDLRHYYRAELERDRWLARAAYAARRWALLLSVFLGACGGSTSSPPSDNACRVPFERDGASIMCEFDCADCDGSRESCERALPTAIDHCLYQLREKE